MPLDILPAPVTAPSGAASGASANTASVAPGLTVSGGALAVFSLLLAQVGQPPSVGAQPSAAKSGLAADTTVTTALTGIKSQTSSHMDKSKDNKSKDNGTDKAAVTNALWTLPAPVIPLAPPVNSPVIPPAPTATNITAAGTAMDTAPLGSGELLSQTHPASAQTPSVETPSVETPSVETLSAQTPSPQTPLPQTPSPQTPSVEMLSAQTLSAQTPSAVAQIASVIVPAEAAGTTQLPTTDIIVPTEPNGLNAPAALATGAAASSLVPLIAAQASQAVILPATPLTTGARTQGKPAPATAQTPAQAQGKSTAAVPSHITAPVPVSTPSAPQNGATPYDLPTGNTPPPDAATPPGTPQADGTTQAGDTAQFSAPGPPGAALPQAKSTSEKVAAPTKSATDAVPATQPDQSTVSGAVLMPAMATVQTPGAGLMPEADRTRMVAQVADSVQTLATQSGGNGQHQMTLQIHPKDWGQVNVSVTMTPTTGADGKVTTQIVATVVAQNPQVKAALETHSADLRHALQGAGLHLDTLTVTVQASAAGAQTGLGNDRHPDSNGGWAGPQSQTAGAGDGSGAGFNSNGSRQSGSTDFGQGDTSGRRPPSPYATAQTQTAAGADGRTVSSAISTTRNSAGRVDIHA